MASASPMYVDAVAFQEESKSKLTSEQIESGLRTLTLDELLEMCLLGFGSLVEEQANLLWEPLRKTNLSKTDIGKTLKCVLNDSLFLEILFYMQKLKLLKTLGFCVHMMEREVAERRLVSDFWKFIYDLLQDMDDEEVKRFVHLIMKQNLTILPALHELQKRNIKPEVSLLYMYRHKCFSMNKLHLLHSPLKALQRNDLLDRLKEFEAKNSYYEIRSGLAIIINQIDFTTYAHTVPEKDRRKDRVGSISDELALVTELRKYDFTLHINRNLKKQEIIELLETNATTDSSQYSCFVVCIFSHGNSGEIEGIDYESVKLSHLMKIFGECENLKGKPKVFIIQACQGNKHLSDLPKMPERLISVGSRVLECDGPGVPKLIPDYVDMFCAVAIVDGYYSYRSQHGSLFIQSLAKHLSIHGDYEDIDSILKRVTKDLADNSYVQVPKYESTLTRKLQLKVNPLP